MRTLSRKFFAIGLLLALLVCSTGRAVPVFALADPIPQQVAPVFDTQIYQLQDYIDHGGLGEPQLEIFYILAGLYAGGQFASEEYRLNDPYGSQPGVLNWLKSCGIELYNTVIGLAPSTIQLPDGSIMPTDHLKRSLSSSINVLMGCAQTASQYETVEDFEEDIENNDHFYMPWSRDIQYGLNTLFQTYGGVYEWQFDTGPFTSNTAWRSVSLPILKQQLYQSYVDEMNTPVRGNLSTFNNVTFGSSYFETYHNIFVDTDNYTIGPCDDSGNYLRANINLQFLLVDSNNNVSYNASTPAGYDRFVAYLNASDFQSYPTMLALVHAYYDFEVSAYYKLFYEDFVDHVYVGDTWANRHEIFNVSDLNLDEPASGEDEYYVTMPDDNNYLLDIKGILLDILNNTDLFDVFINNIYTPDGVLVHDTDLIRVSVKLLEYYQQQNPPIPVNLNDIADYTDNSYLDRIKEEGHRAGSVLANLVAFWHNCDAELIYVLFGAGITVLIGAFIGKWGHS